MTETTSEPELNVNALKAFTAYAERVSEHFGTRGKPDRDPRRLWDALPAEAREAWVAVADAMATSEIRIPKIEIHSPDPDRFIRGIMDTVDRATRGGKARTSAVEPATGATDKIEAAKPVRTAVEFHVSYFDSDGEEHEIVFGARGIMHIPRMGDSVWLYRFGNEPPRQATWAEHRGAAEAAAMDVPPDIRGTMEEFVVIDVQWCCPIDAPPAVFVIFEPRKVASAEPEPERSRNEA